MKKLLVAATALIALASCSKDEDPVIVIPPSSGSTLVLNGLIGSEPGTSAGNSVFVDFSTDKQTSAARDSWDLGFYGGSDFKVTINMTNGAAAVATTKTDINTVTAADFKRDTLAIGLNGFVPVGSFAVIDDPRELSILNKTAIAPVSAADADNKVYILNRKGGDATVLDENLYKVRILRKNNGYTLQYARLAETTFKTLDITKNADYNFQFASVVSGAVVPVEPAKESWDIAWTYTMNYTGTFPYAFSDFVLTNNLAGVSAFERTYATAEIAASAYTNFNKDSVSKYALLQDRDVVGSKWRTSSQTATGVKTDRFYVVKDGAGNVYKLKFVSFSSQDGGTRGKPEIKYELIK